MEKGDFIRIAYVGRLESGEIFDLTDEELAKKEGIFNKKARYVPIPVIIGAGFVLPGLEKALEGMGLNEKKDVMVEPKDGFGERDSKMIRVVPAKNFENGQPKPGMVVDFGNIKGRVQSASSGRVMVDFNHPLAGKRLKYEVEIKGKIEGKESQAEAILEYFGVSAKISVEGNIIKVTGQVGQKLKENISSVMLKWISSTEKVEFLESFGKKEEVEKSDQEGK